VVKAPYKRGYKHSKNRGNEVRVVCSYCGKIVPRYKTFTKVKGFGITDSSLRKEFSRDTLRLSKSKIYVCPSCARHRRISQPGKLKKTRRQT